MITLGCPKNRVDSEQALWQLQESGADLTTDESAADILLVNTCGFIESAKEESIDTILELAQMKRARPDVKLAVMGCLSGRYKSELMAVIPEIDHIFGVADFKSIVQQLTPVANNNLTDPDGYRRVLTSLPHTAYLKIAEGCSNNCSFCVIPQIRGPFISRKPEDILSEARMLVDMGAKELILVAQDTTLYGADLKIDNGLSTLLEQLAEIENLDWIRVMYMYPKLVTTRLLRSFSKVEKVAPYFDIPFQHASDKILRSMGRPEDNKYIRNLIDRIKTTVPGAALRTSFIIGFPGETEDDFLTLQNLAEDVQFDHLGVFEYSAEEGSGAYNLGDRPENGIVKQRVDTLMNRQREISTERLKAKIGKVIDVMIDGFNEDENLLVGREITQAPEIDGSVILDSLEGQAGAIVKVKVTGSTDYDLIAKPIG